MIYFISDTHFGHKGIMRHCPWRNRWADVPSMNEGIIEMWNRQVRPDDTVYFLGDFAMAKSNKTKAIIARLNGHKIMVLGNHDRGRQFYLDNGFEQVFENHTEIMLSDINRNPVRKAVLSHYPYLPGFWKRMYYHIFDRKMLRELARHPVNKGEILIHGHVHNRWFMNGNMINAGLDARNTRHDTFDFLSENDVLYLFKTAQIDSSLHFAQGILSGKYKEGEVYFSNDGVTFEQTKDANTPDVH